jgi:LPXTG-motif cell wall-anchored protein
MSRSGIFGVALLAAGIVMLYFGYQASQSVGEQVLESFTGRFTDSTIWYLVFGAAASLAGLGLLILRR